MKQIKENIKLIQSFLKNATHYFRDVVFIHFFILVIFIPSLVGLATFLLDQGSISYLSYDNLGDILLNHPFVFLGLLGLLLLLLVTLFFEIAFLMQSVYFIQKKLPITVKQLVKGTLSQLRKVNKGVVLFFFFYFFLVAPIGGIKFNSELLTKIKIPVFILDVVFANRVFIVSAVILLYLFFLYLSIRLIFVLPELIFNNRTLKKAIKISWQETKQHFIKVFIRLAMVMLTISLVVGGLSGLLLLLQTGIEAFIPVIALESAVLIMTLIQGVLLINLLFSAVGLFYVIIDYMLVNKMILKDPEWYQSSAKKVVKYYPLKLFLSFISVLIVLLSLGTSNYYFLSQPLNHNVLTISHRGVDNQNHVQNSLEALKLTSEVTHPDYVEMDIQETKDHEFVVYHDFDLKPLTKVAKKPYELTLKELETLTVKENGQEAKIISFDAYLAEAKKIKQKLLIEIKTTKNDSPNLVPFFIERYGKEIREEGHTIQSLTYDTVQELKEKAPDLNVGYILPFSVVGPPKGLMDFFTIEYTTLNQNFIESAHSDGKKVYVWTPNDKDTMNRMLFYGVDGMITDRMALLNQTINHSEEMTYSDKIMYFVIGMG